MWRFCGADVGGGRCSSKGLEMSGGDFKEIFLWAFECDFAGSKGIQCFWTSLRDSDVGGFSESLFVFR